MLETFEHQGLDRVSLVVGSGGVFDVTIDGDVAFSKGLRGSFPESEDVIAEVRRRLG